MKEIIIQALAAAGTVVNKDISDDELKAKYDEMLANQSSSDSSEDSDTTDLTEVVANALKPVTEELASIKKSLKANSDAELDQLASVVANSGKYEGLSKEDIMGLGIDKVKSMATNCQVSFGIPLITPAVNSSKDEWKEFGMPE